MGTFRSSQQFKAETAYPKNDRYLFTTLGFLFIYGRELRHWTPIKKRLEEDLNEQRDLTFESDKLDKSVLRLKNMMNSQMEPLYPK